jgi:hypothetical protein
MFRGVKLRSGVDGCQLCCGIFRLIFCVDDFVERDEAGTNFDSILISQTYRLEHHVVWWMETHILEEPALSALIEAVGSAEVLEPSCQTRWCLILEDCSLNIAYHEHDRFLSVSE